MLKRVNLNKWFARPCEIWHVITAKALWV